MIVMPDFKTVPGMNVREHWATRARRVKAEKSRTALELRRLREKPALPCVVTLQRFTPSHRPLDDDNLRGALKAVRDAVADWLQVDDGDTERVRFEYAQATKCAWAVGVAFSKENDSGDR